METQITELTEPIKIFYTRTDDVPAGIPSVFEELENKVGDLDKYHLYGVTECAGDKLIYRAGVEEHDEGEDFGLPDYSIAAGKYLYITLNNWREHIQEVAPMFDELMKLPDVKKGTICLEDYRSATELRLMVEHK